MQLWGGTADRRVPVDSNVQLLAGLLGDRAEVHIVDGAGHFAFLAPCNPALKAAEPEIWEMVCVDGSGFDRPAFQRDFDAQVVRFFSSALKP